MNRYRPTPGSRRFTSPPPSVQLTANKNKSLLSDQANHPSTLPTHRHHQSISQADLATAVGLHTNALGRYERDEALPSIEVATKIAKALEISLDYLTGLTDVELDPFILNRIQEITSLADTDREHVFKVVDALIRDAKK